MSARGLKLLVAALSVLVAVWLLVTFLPGGGGSPEGTSALSEFLAGIDPATVRVVKLEGPGQGTPVLLERQDGEWTVNGFRADSATVARFWAALREAKVGGLAATNPANHGRLGVTADSAWIMDVETTAGERELLVGKPGSTYGTSYARLPNEDDVYLLDGNLRPEVTRSLDGWRNKRLARVDTAAVWQIQVENDDAGFSLERSDSLWVVKGDGGANSAPVRSLLGELARLDASGFYETSDSLPARGGEVMALGRNGDTLFAAQVGAGDVDRWIRIPGDSIIYRLASWRASSLLPTREQVQGEGGG